MNRDGQEFSIFEPNNNVNYGRDSLPSARDGQIQDLLLEVADGAEFEQIKRLMPGGADRVLNAFAERAASLAVRHQSARELRAGILAAAISQAITGDPREPLAALSLLYRASEIIGHDPNSEFATANDLSGGRANGLLDFLRRSPADKTIQAMGYEESGDEGGFRFVRNW
ncbi:hypothetical protein [Micromonospora ureilytica]|uniref:Uncharacterized protein n=1 Tax=Micromonospora ureilytica TaxID=709868 RepID=A0ABS0JFC0_9ACTN|nr:hypothetical protein [Micromonospora ureilytica]MBG6065770.1 hypothetical protein [Micromonospora ureilytica]